MTSEEGRRLNDPYPLDPDEEAGFLVPGADPATAVASGTRYRDIYGAMLVHRPHDLWVATDDTSRDLQDLIRLRLHAQRFSLDDADEWAFRDWHMLFVRAGSTYCAENNPRLCDKVVELAIAHRDHGIPNDEAFLWITLFVNAADAVHYRNDGWTPDTYRTLLSRRWPKETPTTPEAWIEAPIPAWRALRYLRAGLTLTEALAEEKRRHAGEDVDAAIDLVLGLTAKAPS